MEEIQVGHQQVQHRLREAMSAVYWRGLDARRQGSLDRPDERLELSRQPPEIGSLQEG